MSTLTITPGPWRWELNRTTKSLHLVGGKPKFDLTIIQPVRWGTHSATLYVRDTAHDGMNILHKLHDRQDWIKPFPGRDHHADWCAGVTHPDMRLIEAAPKLLEVAELALRMGCYGGVSPSTVEEAAKEAVAYVRGAA